MGIDVTAIIVAFLGSGILTLILNKFFEYRQKKITDSSATNKALRLIVMDRVKFLCTTYLDRGWIHEYEREDLLAMHECYHTDLKGNGYLDDLMSRVKNLEVRRS